MTVDEILMLSNGKSPVRISHRPSKIIPRFLPAKLFVDAILPPSSDFVTAKFYAGADDIGQRSGYITQESNLGIVLMYVRH